MNNLTRCNTTNGTDRHFGRLFNELLSDPFFTLVRQPVIAINGTEDAGSLALDISETEKDVIVRASLPGFTKQEISVELHDGVLTIEAEHNEEHEEHQEKFYRKERRFGSFSRRIELPVQVEDSATQGELRDGVLTLRLPKVAKAQAHKVMIN
ncbi:MAG: Hsp20/alpha crystallin family protein [Phycisphaerales bacterium]|nr:Hsp20/alpha crystallin family protein [Phycisphaerales bacterium]